MPKNLGSQFKKALVDYLKMPSSTSRETALISAAKKIYENAIFATSLRPDDYLVRIDWVIKAALQGLSLSTQEASILDALARRLGLESDDGTFHVLTIAENMTNPIINCLQKTMKRFLLIQDQLAKEDALITNSNYHANSFFLSNTDVDNIRAKKSVIDALIKDILKAICNMTNKPRQDFFPVGFSVEQKIERTEEYISLLTVQECQEILGLLKTNIQPILMAKASANDRKINPINSLSNSGKRSALQVHSFDDKWFFNFLAKIVKVIQEVLGIKTSEEKLLERAADDIEKLGIAPK